MGSHDQKRLRIGIIGAGTLGTRHADGVQTYGAEIVAVHDVQHEAAQRLADRHGAGQATTDLQQFFATPMDGIILATPPPIRFDPIAQACARDIHLYIEKPPALHMDEARRCLAEIERAGVISALGFQLRYDPRYERLRALLQGRTVHLVRTVCTVGYYLDFKVTPWFLQKAISGGPIAEQAIHLLDCTRYVLGNARATRVTAIGMKNMALEHTEFDAENVLEIAYQLDNDVFGTHTNHCGHERFHFDLEVIGPNLRLHANVTEPTIHGYMDGAAFSEPVPPANVLSLNILHAWLRAIETGDRSLVRSDYAEALHTMAFVEAAIQGQASGAFEAVAL